MTTATPTDRVVEILLAASYRRAAQPLTVASVPFEFAAILVGSDRAPDLIVVVDTVIESELRIRQKIAGLARALDVAGSRRPLTAVLVGPKPSDATLESMGAVCRVLPVGTPTGRDADALIRDWLAVLLPLPLPDPNQAVADPHGELLQRMPANLDENLRRSLLAAASQGSKSVQRALRDQLAAALVDIESLGGGGT